jgi:hypothetical protein
LSYFAEFCGFVISRFILKICGLAFCGLAHLRNFQISNSGKAEEFGDLGFADFKKSLLFQL